MEFDKPEIARLRVDIAETHGFRLLGQRLELYEEDPIKKQLDALKHNLLITSLHPSDTTHSDEIIIRVIQSRLERLRSYHDKVTHQILEGGTTRPASKAEIENLVERLDTRLKQLVDEFSHPPDFSHHHATLETFHETMEGLKEVFELLKNLC